MNTLVRVRGYITSTHIYNPIKRLIDTEPKYTLSILLENPSIYDELEEKIQQLRTVNMPRMENTYKPNCEHWEEHFESRVINGCEINVESLYKPDIKDELLNLKDDDELLGRFVQLVGHLYIHESGIVCLSSHILETAYHPNDNFEPCLK
ncbi:hypothetical protein [Prochlorococcus marinus]|uniref:hypothetical protein n=1 Tax=Prochlorococcus marinus TaxID=1219 RepID=UPI0022B50537|nr:hypothetical protein [Prochlorococcus marinus]